MKNKSISSIIVNIITILFIPFFAGQLYETFKTIGAFGLSGLKDPMLGYYGHSFTQMLLTGSLVVLFALFIIFFILIFNFFFKKEISFKAYFSSEKRIYQTMVLIGILVMLTGFIRGKIIKNDIKNKKNTVFIVDEETKTQKEVYVVRFIKSEYSSSMIYFDYNTQTFIYNINNSLQIKQIRKDNN